MSDDGKSTIQTLLSGAYSLMRNQGHINSIGVLRSEKKLMTARLYITDKHDVYTLCAVANARNFSINIPKEQFGNTKPFIKQGYSTIIGTEYERENGREEELWTLVPLFPNARYARFQDITWVVDPNTMYDSHEIRGAIVTTCEVTSGKHHVFTRYPVPPMVLGFDGSVGHDHVVVPVMPHIDLQAFGEICLQPHITSFKPECI